MTSDGITVITDRVTDRSSATDHDRLETLFGPSADLLPLWIAEPYVDLAPDVVAAIQHRAAVGWYGYESRPETLFGAFWEWMAQRHGWNGSHFRTSVSPSVGTSIGALLELRSAPGDGVILQPPVFTDFKPLVVAAGRTVVRNSLRLTSDGYRMDLTDLEAKAADPATRVMILCNPHNPVGRVWSEGELRSVAEICAANDVFVIADEIHADLVLPPHPFTPFATVVGDTGLSWAATHGPIKTFGLAGVCDTLLVTDNEELTKSYRAMSSRLHLTRNNVFGIAAFETAYQRGARWLDGLLDLVADNAALLASELPDGIELIEPEGTYLAWLDFRALGLDVPGLARWLATAGLALSPGHWFGREGAGFARMTIAAPQSQVATAIERLAAATT